MIRPHPKPGKHKKRASRRIPCAIRRCKRRVEFDDLCKKHLVDAMDGLARHAVLERDSFTCRLGCRQHVGSIQWCHIVSRRYLSVRWHIDNGVAGCAGGHTLYTNHPDWWVLKAEELIGAEKYRWLLERARANEKPDLALEYQRLKALSK